MKNTVYREKKLSDFLLKQQFKEKNENKLKTS